MIYFGILLAGFLSFMLGALWYTALFGKAWKKATGFDDPEKLQEMEKNSNIPLTMGTTLVVEIIVAAIIAYTIFYFNITEWSQILLLGAILGVFAVTANIKNYLYENKSMALFFISEGYKFTVTILMVVILKFFI